MRFSVVAVAVLLSLSTLTQAQEHPAVTAQANSVFTGADGKFETAPDTALVQFNISAQADTAKAAYDLAARQTEQTREILRANGIEPKSAEIGYYSIQPQYDWKNPRQKVVGYRVTSNVTVKLKDFGKVGAITQQLADAQVSTGQSVGYILENMEDAKGKAVEDAYRKARMAAESVARASGRVLGDLSYASVDTFENIRPMQMPRPMSMMKADMATPPPTEEFTPQSVSVTAHVNAMFNLK